MKKIGQLRKNTPKKIQIKMHNIINKIKRVHIVPSMDKAILLGALP